MPEIGQAGGPTSAKALSKVAWLTRVADESSLGLMTIQLKIGPEVTTYAERLARLEGMSVEQFLSKTLEAFVLEEQQEEALLLARLAEADRGEFLTAEEMQQRFERMLAPR